MTSTRKSQDIASCSSIFVSFILSLSVAFASSQGFANSGGGEKKKKVEKGEHGEKTSEEIAEESIKRMTITDRYVHSWLAMPKLTGLSLVTDKPEEIKPPTHSVVVLYFIASWCVPCQTMFPTLSALDRKYSEINATFYYVFTHDTAEDAKGFMRTYGVTKNAYLADHKTIKEFHNPQLPTVYVGDRNGWLSFRFQDTKPEDLKILAHRLELMTSY